MSIRSGLVLLAGLLLATVSHADFVATYKVKDGGQMKISYRDSSHIRMQVSDESFMLLDGGKLWMVNRKGNGWMAMDLSQMSGMMQGMQGMMQQGQQEVERSQDDVDFVDTGKTETVAGYKGNIYEVRDKAGGKTRTIVLTDHKDVENASKAMLEFGSEGFGAMGGQQSFSPPSVLEMAGSTVPTGLLRQEDNIRLHSINKNKLEDSVFSLPPGTQVQQMPSMPGGFPGMGGDR